jgi:uncharacterized phage-associated protein
MESMAIAHPDFKPEPALGFDHLKSVQIIAYFVRKAGGTAEKLKLVKLLYLADRLSFQRRGKPLNFDSYFSLPHGPVVSSALNGMDHRLDDPAWNALDLGANRRDVMIVDEINADHLSRADVSILDATWDEFGGMTSWQIRDWTHDNCEEYVEVGASASLPIDVSEIMQSVGRPDPDNAAREVRAMQKQIGRLERLRAA